MQSIESHRAEEGTHTGNTQAPVHHTGCVWAVLRACVVIRRKSNSDLRCPRPSALPKGRFPCADLRIYSYIKILEVLHIYIKILGVLP